MIKKFTLFLGLCDKDSKLQKISTVEAYKMVQNILFGAGFDGGTIFEANGFYKHTDGSVVIEPSFKIEILDFGKIGIRPLVDELKRVFNQESIAVQEEDVNSYLL